MWEFVPSVAIVMPIRRLPESLVNKIAAGEVIERPASVVKELLENAVDAGAQRIDVSVLSGGLELIRVADDGCGIPAEELPLAVAPHATSKLQAAEDLFCVRTLGFRGEALASIAEVSRMTIRSRTADSAAGAQLEVVGGTVGQVVPCAAAVGTVVEVRELFFNTPVRRRFLRAPQTELSHVCEAFIRIALATSGVHFSLRHNDRPLLEVEAEADLRQRIARLFGPELADSLIAVQSSDGPVSISGYVAPPAHSRSHNRMQYFFLNGRYIRDRALQHALGEAYRGLLMSGRYPIAFLVFSMPPELVDVNVHPTKLEVRFQDGGRLYSQLLSALRSKFLTSDLAPRMPGQSLAAPGEANGSESQPEGAEQLRFRQQFVQWAKAQVSSWPTADTGDSNAAARAVFNVGRGPRPAGPLVVQRIDRPAPAPSAGPHPAVAPPSHGEQTARSTPDDKVPHGQSSVGLEEAAFNPLLSGGWPTGAIGKDDQAECAPQTGQPASARVGAAPEYASAGSRPPALQIHNKYLVTETEEGVLVIDQHALHERILYEHLRRRVHSGAIEIQNLLVPEPVDLGPAEAAAALEHRALLGQLGICVEPFGGNTVLITGFPAMLANLDPVELLRNLIAELTESGRPPDRLAVLDRLLHTIACRAAVKAGDRLSDEEIRTLLEQRHLVGDHHHCPHGRPTAVILTREELDRQFGR